MILREGRLKMKIFITGGSGFIGKRLSAFLLGKGHNVTAIGRRPLEDFLENDHFTYLKSDTSQSGKWQESLQEMDAVINLAGQTIFKRWSKRYKQIIYDSRILTTRHIVEALSAGGHTTLCSASAAGYYGDRADDILTEIEPPGSDFLAHVTADWETEALLAEEKGTRVVTARFGIVLGKGGGALSKMIPAFKSFAGGPVGSGTQWFPWIHIDDLAAAVLFVIENSQVKGSVNFCAPHPVRNRELSNTLGKILNRPALVPVPAFILRIALGELGTALLASQRVVPERLTQSGFAFKHPEIEKAISAIVAS